VLISLHFTVSESFGDKPISEWLLKKVKEFVFEKHGLDVQVSLNLEKVGQRPQSG
jgi:hypothetical protein